MRWQCRSCKAVVDQVQGSYHISPSGSMCGCRLFNYIHHERPCPKCGRPVKNALPGAYHWQCDPDPKRAAARKSLGLPSTPEQETVPAAPSESWRDRPPLL